MTVNTRFTNSDRSESCPACWSVLITSRAVVIEINDNPSIAHEVEDAVLGDELYYRILNHFVHCLNRLHAQ